MVSLELKTTSGETARKLWDAYSSRVLAKAQELNNMSDPNIQVLLLLPEPVITQSYRSLVLDVFFGVWVGLVIGIAVISAKKYLC